MKKLALSLAVLFSVALVSCGGAKEECTDSCCDSAAVVEVVDTTVVDTNAVDTTVVDTTVAE